MHKHTHLYACPNMEICGYERVHHRVNLAWNQWPFNWKACAAFSKITSLTQKSQAVWQRYFAGPWGQLQPGKNSPSWLSPHNHPEPVWSITFSLSWTKILQWTELKEELQGSGEIIWSKGSCCLLQPRPEMKNWNFPTCNQPHLTTLWTILNLTLPKGLKSPFSPTTEWTDLSLASCLLARQPCNKFCFCSKLCLGDWLPAEQASQPGSV